MEPRLAPGWTLLAPRKKTYYRFKNRHRGDYPPICLHSPQDVWDAWYCLARIPRGKSNNNNRQPATAVRADWGARNGTNNNNPSRLESLPAEILALVLEAAILSRTDIINLGLSSPVLWRHVLAHTQRDCTHDAGSLIGAEIACLSDWTDNFSPSFKRDNYQLVEKVIRRCYTSSSNGWSLVTVEFNTQRLNEGVYRAGLTASEAWVQVFNETCNQNTTTIRSRAWSASTLAAELKEACSIAPLFGPAADPDPRCWLLRNLTTQESAVAGGVSGFRTRTRHSLGCFDAMHMSIIPMQMI
ncbi:hypothetical protein VTN96DRAFT_4082 [Rasamsonia emersonii]